MPSGPIASEAHRTIYIDDCASYRHILAAVMHRAWRDAMGQIESGCKCKDEVMIDAALYFEDGRAEWHMELLGVDPSLRPDWRKS